MKSKTAESTDAGRPRLRGLSFRIFLGALALYLLTSYAGIRSSDSEVTFEACDAIRDSGQFAVRGESSWTGFGLAPGKNGNVYSIFGPLQSITCVPFLAAADLADRTAWFEHLTPQRSHYIDGGIAPLLRGTPPVDLLAHARRSLVAWLFNSLVGAACVLVLFRALLRVTRFPQSALLLAAAYGGATLAWPYSGTFLSEPLATLLVLVSFDRVLVVRDGAPPISFGPCVWAGACLGLAVAAHLTAILFCPFWLLILSRLKVDRARLLELALFAVGMLPWLVLLAAYNHLRFGSIMESGRGVAPDRFGYGVFQAPWRGLYGLTLSPGKGLLLFCPAVVLGLLGWASFHRAHRVLSVGLLAALGARLLFIASRSDWHGGFCLGPRYLVMALPFMLLPAVSWFDEIFAAKRWRALTAVVAAIALCSLQQLYFVVGEVFSFLHSVKLEAAVRKSDPFFNDDIYLRWQYSPLSDLLDGMRGPYLFKRLDVSNRILWLFCAAGVLLGWTALSRWLRRSAWQ